MVPRSTRCKSVVEERSRVVRKPSILGSSARKRALTPEFVSPAEELDHRARLLDAITDAVTEKGYAQVTIADIVRHARVSKRTFYENFVDKEACFLAAYSAMSDQLLTRIAAAAMAEREVEARLSAAAEAYVGMLEERPALTRTLLLEIQAAGDKALKLRRVIQERFVDLLCVLVELARAERPELASLPRPLATAIAGGINELLLHTLERGPTAELGEVGRTAVLLLRSVLLRDASSDQLPATRVERNPASKRALGRVSGHRRGPSS